MKIIRKTWGVAAALSITACVGNMIDSAGQPSAERPSAEKIKSAVADWVKSELGWKDYRIELKQGSAEGEVDGWFAVVYSLPETPGDHVMISIDASGKFVSNSLGR